jgi:hypothetical protein
MSTEEILVTATSPITAEQKSLTKIPIYIYLHTHWDREWFLTFSMARALLLDRVKKTLSALEAGQLPNFYLDGQAVVLEDVIELEPELGERIRRALTAGHLSAGPWYVLPDQSLVGGESLIRNLKLGIDIVKRFGRPAMTGYNPDTFCHVQDLPRILQGFGIRTALVLRGVPPLENVPMSARDSASMSEDSLSESSDPSNGTRNKSPGNVFWWDAPDGSRVLTYWLNKGLTHNVFHKSANEQEIAHDLLSRWDLDGVTVADTPMLYSSGGEGMQPPGEMLSKVEKVNAILPERCEAKVVSMEDFLVHLEDWAKDKALPIVSGDLRDNRSVSEQFPAYVLDGVSSTRLYLKRDNALAEHRLIRITEPLYALLHALGVASYPESSLTHVWKLLIQNHPHDSICGCSIDAVHQEMRTRTQQLNSFLDGLDSLALENVFEWSGNDSPLHKSSGQTNSPKSILPEIAAPQPIDPDLGNDRLLIFNTSCNQQIMPVPMTWYCPITATLNLPPDQVQIESESLEQNQLFHSAGGFYYKPVRRITGWIWPDAAIPALGFSERQWSGLSDKSIHSGSNHIGGIAQTERSQNDIPVVNLASQAESKECFSPEIDNGLIRLRLDKNGDLLVKSLDGGKQQEFRLGHHLYDVGDGGDSYNFDPLPNDVPLKAKLVSVEAGKQGPLVASLIVKYELRIPRGIDNDSLDPQDLDKRRSQDLLEHSIKTEVILKRGVPILFFDTVFENRSADHRLSVRFSLNKPSKASWSECHFSLGTLAQLGERPKLPVPIGHEIPPESYFCQRFFINSGQIFFNIGLPEYCTGKDFVEITLLRAVSYLSRGRLRRRGGGAGPWQATPEANCYGINRCQYAWAFTGEQALDRPSDQQVIEAYRLADLFEVRLVPIAVGKFNVEQDRALIKISNPSLYVTAFYVEDGKLFLRMLNLTTMPQESSVEIKLPVSAVVKVNLSGTESAAVPWTKQLSDGIAFKLDFNGIELITLRFDL